MPPVEPSMLAHDDIVPVEVKRLRIEPGETLVIRIADRRWSAQELHRYREWLDVALPDVPTVILIADEIAVMAMGEGDDDGD